MDYNPVGWFEIPVTDMERARTFYKAVFGYETEPHKMGEFDMAWFPSDPAKKGIQGSLMKGMGYVPTQSGTFVYFTAPDLDGTLSKVEEAGGKIYVPKKDIGEWGYIAIIGDSEGNSIGLHMMKK